MSRPAVSFLRTAVRRIALPAPAPSVQLTLSSRAFFATKSKASKRLTRLPTEAVFEEVAKFVEVEGRDVHVYYRCVEEWARAVNNGKTDDPNILKKLKVSPQTFHEAAVFLQWVRMLVEKERVPTSGNPFSNQHPWTVPMLRYASDQGHEASTLVCLNFELEAEACQYRSADNPTNLPEVLLSRLDDIIATNLSPDAIVIGARLAERDGDDPLAADLASRAVQLADGTGIPCEWLSQALIIQGRVQARAGRLRRAREFFLEATARRDSGRAWLELLYDGRAPEAMQRAYTCAVSSGDHDQQVRCCVSISQAENELGVLALERGDKTRFKDHQFMAEEWLRLANTKKKDVE